MNRSSVVLAASGGGHVDLLEALEDACRDVSRTWVVAQERRALALARRGERVFLLPSIHRTRRERLANVRASVGLALRLRPDVVVCAGAGDVVAFSLAARLLGARIVFLETTARVTSPSSTARLVSRFSTRTLVQWPELVTSLPRAAVCRPALWDVPETPGVARPFEPLGTLVAVGSHIDGFDRLVSAVDAAVSAGVLPTPVRAQVGPSAYPPRTYVGEDWIPAAQMAELIGAAQLVVCHAGSGIVSAALRAGHRPIVMPRLARHGEHVDDHQSQLAAKLDELDLAVAVQHTIEASDVERAHRPRRALAEAVVAPRMLERLREFLEIPGPR